jgi:SAM-dependent methyltransferase
MSDQQRWETEQKFFDDEEYDDRPIPPSTVERYTTCRKPWLAPEFPFHALGDVRGKYILELGCGDGSNAIILALREIARHRAEAHGVSRKTTFVAKPLELFEPPDGRRFDIVCGWAVLHHVIPVLDATLHELTRFAKPEAFVLFSEPVSMWRWLRKLRLMLPIPVHGTPDERPLEPAEIAIVRRHVPELKVRYHNAAIRIANRYIHSRYEDLSAVPRALYDSLARIDEFCLNRLGLRGLASVAAMYGRCGK